MKSDNKVKTYFKVRAKDFDEIYDWMTGSQNNLFKKILNRIFRRGMVERFNLALLECEPNKNILDIGCGSGRISIALAEKGANITGIDYSPVMIDLANKYLKKYEQQTNTKLNINYQCCDFMIDSNSEKKFDTTLAIGVFDYLKDPLPFLKKMKAFSKEKIIISFPAKLTFQMPIRTLWLWTKKCPVYFYTKKRIKAIFKDVNIINYDIVDIAAGFFVKAYV